jgi:DMSO/TMAO reductase YedYZ molybdopterin-dependent catalytic subunit
MARRKFLRSLSAVPLALAAPGLAFGGDPQPDKPAESEAEKSSGKLIVRQKDPANLEMPFASLKGFVTPNDLFYVRNHFAVPRLDPREWRLELAGEVERPLRLSYDDLRKLPSATQITLLECAGNGRSFLEPKAKGVQWGTGAVGNAEWTGVPLSAVLEKAGVKKSAVEVILEGADKGTVADEPKSPGEIHFARSLPLDKALRPDVLLAYRMNGEPLPAEHGFPLRAVVPGWYGMASIKWLTRIVVVAEPFHGYYQSLHYTYFQRRHGLPSVAPITTIEVKSHIARPAAEEKVPAGKPYRVYGAAWSGECAVRKVELSLDGGKTWATAKLAEQKQPHTWQLWEFAWKSPPSGAHELISRATDANGRTQPLTRDADRRSYMINHVVGVPVRVE